MTRFLLTHLCVFLMIPASCSESDTKSIDTFAANGEVSEVASDDDLMFMSPVWSPGGSRIAFTSGQYRGIWIVNPDGSDLRQITGAESAGYQFQWAPDDKTITARIAHFDGPERYFAIVAYDIETGNKTYLMDFSKEPVDPPAKPAALPRDFGDRIALNATYSPDSTKIAFQLMGEGVFVMMTDKQGSSPGEHQHPGPGEHRKAPYDDVLPEQEYRHLGPGEQPVWTPDSNHLIVSVSSDDGHYITASDLYTIRVKDGERTLLTGHTDLIALHPTVSPDGRRIAFSDDKSGSICVMSISRP